MFPINLKQWIFLTKKIITLIQNLNFTDRILKILIIIIIIKIIIIIIIIIAIIAIAIAIAITIHLNW